jgi:S1-C subfamily serine protease
MTIIDWAIIALAAVMATIGYRQGLLSACLGLGGFAAGAVIGARLAPLLLSEGSSSPWAPAIALAGGVIGGAAVSVLGEALAIAIRRRFIRGQVSHSVDAIGGAVVFVALALAISWVLGALALNAPAFRGIRADAQRSLILGAVNDVAPPSGPLLNVLHRVGNTPELSGPSADVAKPDPGVVDDPDVVRAGQSVVHVLGTACGLNVSGSGWIAADGVVVTNAHVVAGEDDTHVVTKSGAELSATPILYRPDDDVAVLRVAGLAEPPLPFAKETGSGTSGAVLGYPGEGDFSAIPARLGTTGEVTSQDSYGRGPIQRQMTSLRAEVISGNSGGPFVDGDGAVAATIFAASLDSQPREGLGVPNAVVRDALAAAGQEVDTGPCA